MRVDQSIRVDGSGAEVPLGLFRVVSRPGLSCPSVVFRRARCHRPVTPAALSAAAGSAVSDPAAPAMDADQARQLLKALADPIRLDVVQALTGGERCVCELTEQLGLAQSRLSFHLRVMRDAGLIEAREQGRWVYYKLCPEAVERLQAWLAGIAASSRQPARPCC